MDEEIDVRLLVTSILKHWRWIAATVSIFALLAFIIGSILPATYETTALVAVTEPSQLVSFVAGYEDIQEIIPDH